MSLPDKFILAKPNRSGNSIRHYTLYCFDLQQRLIYLDRTKHDYDPVGITHYYEGWTGLWRARRVETFRSVMMARSRGDEKERMRFIMNGRTLGYLRCYINLEKREGSSSLTSVFPEGTPIRFEPLTVDYFECHEPKYKESSIFAHYEGDREFDKIIKAFTDVRYSSQRWTTWQEAVYKFEGDNAAWGQILKDIESIYDRLSLSQIKFTAKGTKASGKTWSQKVRSAFELTYIHARDFDEERLILKRLGLDKSKPTLKFIKKVINRYCRRHKNSPSTTKLLQLLAAGSSLKKIKI